MGYSKLLVTTESGHLNLIDGNDIKTLYDPKDGSCMGLAMDDDFIYMASEYKLYKLNKGDYSLAKSTHRFPRPRFHQMSIYDDVIYMAHTTNNSVMKFNLNLDVVGQHKIRPPRKGSVNYGSNYNHINSVIKHEDMWYVNLCRLNVKHGLSGIAICDENFNEIERKTIGWESHNTQFIGDDLAMAVACSKPEDEIHHPYKSGLIVNDELVFDHDPSEAFCKALTYDDNYIYLCGGAISIRENRKTAQGIIYILDKNDYTLIEKLQPEGLANIKGVLVYE